MKYLVCVLILLPAAALAQQPSTQQMPPMSATAILGQHVGQLDAQNAELMEQVAKLRIELEATKRERDELKAAAVPSKEQPK